MSIEVADRYTALGIKPSGCKGPCEGTGVVPVYVHPERTAPNETDPELLRRWKIAEEESAAEDGWHFVTCPECEI